MENWQTFCHSSDICKEKHNKLLPFTTFKRELVNETTFDCERKVADYDTIRNDSYAYGIVNLNDCLDSDELVDIVNDTLSKNWIN